MTTPRRTHLLFRPGALGDALLTVPLVTLILERHPNDELVWYQSPWTCELPWAKILPGAPQSNLSIRSFELDECAAWLAIQTAGSTPVVFSQFLGSRRELASITLVTAQPVDGLIDWCAQRSIRCRWVPAPTGAVQVPPHAAERLAGQDLNLKQSWLHNKVPAANRGNRLAVLHPGAGSRAKQMDLQHWAELADHRRKLGIKVEYVLGPAELDRKMDAALLAADPQAKIRVTTTLAGLLDRIHVATEFWGHDSGPTHLAGMLGIRTNVFFGPTNPDVWRPLGPDVIIHRFSDSV